MRILGHICSEFVRWEERRIIEVCCPSEEWRWTKERGSGVGGFHWWSRVKYGCEQWRSSKKGGFSLSRFPWWWRISSGFESGLVYRTRGGCVHCRRD